LPSWSYLESLYLWFYIFFWSFWGPSSFCILHSLSLHVFGPVMVCVCRFMVTTLMMLVSRWRGLLTRQWPRCLLNQLELEWGILLHFSFPFFFFKSVLKVVFLGFVYEEWLLSVLFICLIRELEWLLKNTFVCLFKTSTRIQHNEDMC
jgi:hypothetical protein